MKHDDPLHKHEKILQEYERVGDGFTRVMDWIFNAIGAGAGGWLGWIIAGAFGAGFLQQGIAALVGAVIGVIAMRIFFFVGQFFA